jgi:phosphatidate cytidylyltransferase
VTGNAGRPDARTDRADDAFPVRLASGLILAAAALGVAWIGGGIFVAFWGAAAVIVAWEWINLVARARDRWLWFVAGGVYAAVTFVAPATLRGLRPDQAYGFSAIVFLFAIVWITDIMGYAVGRAIGGRKLWPAVSPNKTWSGAIGAVVGALGAGLAVAAWDGMALAPIAILAMILSMVAQGGDLFESAIKRKFGAKDTSDLIPGHGGLMDRLDGFIAAALAAALIGAWRGGGFDGAARGLLVW